jgi:N-acetylmuramoyl-L-alanine amidase
MIKYYVALILMLSTIISAQNLTGKKICLDPGHGFIPGQAGNCNDAETKRFESWMNHYVVPQLKIYLQNAGATIITTRADYDSIGPCITLTQRKTIANNNNVNFFHSVHHNAFNGTSNYSLALFKQISTLNCPTGNPAWPNQADLMASILAVKINQALQTTTQYYRGDSCFLGFNLGVLSTLNMPGTLSEASFWDYPPEILRLKNLAYLKTEAEAIYYSFLQYYNAGLPSHGSLVGFVTNTSTNSPAKKVTVSIEGTAQSYIVDSLGNGFYRIDSLAPGNYTIRVRGPRDSSFTNVTITGGKINLQNLTIQQTDIVGDVKLTGVISTTNAIQAYWLKPAGTADSFYVYLSENGSTWDTIPYRRVIGTATGTVISGLTANKTYYLKVKAKNAISESPNFSKTYGGYTSINAVKVLIVDGFNRYGGLGSYSNPSHNFASYYGNPFGQLGIKFETVSNSLVTTSAQLSTYKYVIWFLGDESTADETFSDAEQSIVKTYLDGGGNLFVTGSEVAWDLDFNGTVNDKNFFNNYLKAAFVADNPTPNTPFASSISGSIFEGLNINFGQTYPEDWPDVITPINGSNAILQYNATQIAANSFVGNFPSGSNVGKLIYVGFPIETIASDSIRKEILSKAHTFFTTPVSVEDETEIIPKDFSLSVYPNPFNPTAKINFSNSEAGKYQIRVYNLLGEEVMLLFNDYLETGNHVFELIMNNLPSGIYLVNARSENINLSEKVVFLK